MRAELDGVALLAAQAVAAQRVGQLVRGDANYTLVQVSINDIIMIFAFAPIAALLLGVTDIVVPWETLLLSVILYVVIPLAAGYMTRRRLDNTGHHEQIAEFTAKIKPFSVMGLLATVVLLFGFQAQTIIDKPLVIALIAVPLLIQSYAIFAVAYAWAYVWRVPFDTAAPAGITSVALSRAGPPSCPGANAVHRPARPAQGIRKISRPCWGGQARDRLAP